MPVRLHQPPTPTPTPAPPRPSWRANDVFLCGPIIKCDHSRRPSDERAALRIELQQLVEAFDDASDISSSTRQLMRGLVVLLLL